LEQIVTSSIFYQLVAILAIASLVGLVLVKLKQPLVVAFILTGIIVGPDVLNVVSPENTEVIETLAKFGISLLLFMVGLKLDVSVVKQFGFAILVIGCVQIFMSFVLGLLLCLALGMPIIEASIVSLALSFSSTIIVVKLLSDKRAIDSFYGRIALGVLILQDLVVIITTVMLAAFTAYESSGVFSISIVFNAVTLLVLTAVFIKYLSKPISNMLANSSELMVISCISFAVFIAAVCEFLQLSIELGGLIAGIALASTPYNNLIAARMSVLRDFMLLFFFAHLGAHIKLTGVLDQILLVGILSIFVVISKPAIIMAASYFFGIRRRASFLAGISLAQISEFSLILIAMGFSAGLVQEQTLNMVTVVGLITMTISTYGIYNSHLLYLILESNSLLFKSPNEENDRDDYSVPHGQHDVIVFGLGRYGKAMAKLFEKHEFSVLSVDFDPNVVKQAKKSGYKAIYGDAADPELPGQLPLESAKVIVFAFHHHLTGPMVVDLRRTLAESLRDFGYQGHIASTSHNDKYDDDLREHGIDIVLNPFEDAAFHGTEQIIGKLRAERRKRL
jgi:Kef-type K+ transport system membrane component KefB